MEDRKFDELERRSTNELEKLLAGEHTLAEQVIKSQVRHMVNTGEALQLTEEEERMLRAFRRFKIACKPGAVFRWQSRPGEVNVVLAEDTGLVRDPQEVAEASTFKR